MQPILDERINENPDNYLPCFNCEETNCTKVKYTWWGGVLGPKLLHHVKCNVCGSHYNGKTGKSNAQKIAVYVIFLLVVLFAFITLFVAV